MCSSFTDHLSVERMKREFRAKPQHTVVHTISYKSDPFSANALYLIPMKALVRDERSPRWSKVPRRSLVSVFVIQCFALGSIIFTLGPLRYAYFVAVEQEAHAMSVISWKYNNTRMISLADKIVSTSQEPTPKMQQNRRRKKLEIPEPTPPRGFQTMNGFATHLMNKHNSPITSFTPPLVTEILSGQYKESSFPVPVLFWPVVQTGIVTAEHRHLGYDGVLESPFLRPVTSLSDFSSNIVWVIDTAYKFNCDATFKLIINAMAQRYNQGLPTQWPIYFVDFNDGPQHFRCPAIERLMSPELVSYTARTIVRGRRWSDDLGWVEMGKYVGDQPQGFAEGMIYRNVGLAVRTDIVEAVERTLRQQHGIRLSDPLESKIRPVDVLHVWPFNRTKSELKKVNEHEARLRNLVTQLLYQYGKKHDWAMSLGLQGQGITAGRQCVMSEYIDAMLDAKIIVVTQRDGWEDHYRLFEALVSGACVFQDYMIGLPHGLENGTSIVMFRNPSELESLLSYYLSHEEERQAIARGGRDVAMSHHRSWHRLEQLVFGKALSSCSNLKAMGANATECPYFSRFY